jgi:type 1 glutamine amidotransferase
MALGMLAGTLHAAPKKILVVETTAGFRHSSIPTGEKVLSELAQKSGGAFMLDFVRQPAGFPAHSVNGFSAGLKRGATDEERKAFEESEAKWKDALKAALEKLSPESLKNYDAVLFLSTTGDLPIPDPDGFLNWIKNGGAFIGIHAASDTFHHWPGFIEMLGGEFDHHDPRHQTVDCLNQDPTHPATAPLPKVWTITQEEVYQFKKYSPTNVHDLLILDKKPQAPYTPGHYPVSWCKDYGKGKVFYTSLGHREDLWDTDPNIRDRKNSEDISKNYQAHILGAIEWALGLKTSGEAKKD